MTATIILGAQWGDEGKGKIVDMLAAEMDIAIRFQGGANAGHTVIADGKKVVLHQIPSGIMQQNCFNIMANGCVVDAVALIEEIEQINQAGYSVDASRLMISDQAHLVSPMHRFIDRQSGGKIGTTGRGIGPCYTDKVLRQGLRLKDFASTEWNDMLDQHFERTLNIARESGWGEPDRKDLDKFCHALEKIMPMCADTGEFIAAASDKKLLFEGAQGTLLDLDHGTYPYVTSSSTSIGGALTGTGVYTSFTNRIGVFKAYSTRVGNGPFPTEQENETGKLLRQAGNEFGATTGRPRRCGWLDLPLLRRACRINGFNRLVMTKLDCLSEFATIKVAIARDENDQPIYKDFTGWQKPLDNITRLEQLPPECLVYLDFIEKEIGVTLAAISVGPDRRQIIRKRELLS